MDYLETYSCRTYNLINVFTFDANWNFDTKGDTKTV